MALLALGSIALAYPKADAPALLWNASASVATGLYRLTSQPPMMGTLAVIRLPEPLRTLAATRGYLPAGTLLIKPVAAGAGRHRLPPRPAGDDQRPGCGAREVRGPGGTAAPGSGAGALGWR